LWSQQLELYLSIHAGKLRFFTPDGQLIPTPQEAAAAEQQRTKLAQHQVEAAQQQVTELESLLARYRERFGELPEN
jgi:lactam utilization protein B